MRFVSLSHPLELEEELAGAGWRMSVEIHSLDRETKGRRESIAVEERHETLPAKQLGSQGQVQRVEHGNQHRQHPRSCCREHHRVATLDQCRHQQIDVDLAVLPGMNRVHPGASP